MWLFVAVIYLVCGGEGYDGTMDTTTESKMATGSGGGGDERAFLADVFRAESAAVEQLAGLVGDAHVRALDLMEAAVEAGGSVLVAGIGKSGLIGKKISATLASLGVPSHDIHPTEAMHGDLGRIRSVDCVIAISFSGETEEVVSLASILKQDGVPVISITKGAAEDSGAGAGALARVATVALSLGSITEASDLALAPTSSTTATLAMGDALALGIARRRSFTADDFAKRHPGGTLGGLLRPVVDVLRFRVGENLPVVEEGVSVRDAIAQTESIGRRPGALVVTDDAGRVVGICTDSDIRRLIHTTDANAALGRSIGEMMTRSPRVLRDTDLVRDAVRLVREFRSDEIPVVDGDGAAVGMLDVQDLISLKVVQAER